MFTSFYRWRYSSLGLFAGFASSPAKSATVECFIPALGPTPVDGCPCAMFRAISLNSQAESAQFRQKFTEKDTESWKYFHYPMVFSVCDHQVFPRGHR